MNTWSRVSNKALLARCAEEEIHIPEAIQPDREAPLDLSFARLRSVSPVHLQYLENMGVRASCSISILVDGALWGLFIVRLIVEEYGGSVWIEENEPRGSVFVIELERP